ncbi:lantibiotic dehydratase [Streptomyces sp. NPDC101150]|uniref:lantibiotic dehydratase n=1 Tax=Streptomyces sp. NPDC101150 TaxID=3366114 RepID=UPI0037F2BC37
MTSDDDTQSWSLGSRFVLRVAGLPIDAVHPLRFPLTGEWADSVLRQESGLRARGARLSDRLHDIVKANEDDTLRRALINLRRRIWNNKLPDAQRTAELAARLDEETAADVTGWVRDRQTLEELLAHGQRLLEKETGTARAALRRLSAEPRLRRGLQLASPSLDNYLDAYVDAAPGKLSKRQRRLERSLLEYLYRTACKTSPFSTFTSIGLGEFTHDEAAGPTGGTHLPQEWTSHPRINVSVLSRLADLIVADDGLRGDLPVSLTSGWQSDVDRVRYVRRSVTAGETEATVSFDAVRDNLLVLRNSEVLERVFALFEREPEIRWNDLVTRLSGDGADERERAGYGAYLQVLLRLGLLRVPALQVDIHVKDPLRGFSAALGSLGPRFADRFCPGLDRVAECVDAYASAETAERGRLLAQVRQGFETILASLGAPAELLPVTLVFEDTRVTDAGITAGRGEWTRRVGGALRSLESVLPAFDITLPHRLVLKGFFVARFGRGGRCDDLLKLVHDFNEDIFDQYMSISSLRRSFEDDGTYVPHFNWLRLPEMDALDRARVAFAEGMREAYRRRGAGSTDDAEIVLDDDFIARVAAELAPVRQDFAPRSHFLQMSRSDGRVRAVLNRTYGGVLFPFSRFTHCFDDDADGGLTPKLRDELRAATPEGAVFAELTGGHATTNLNLHGRLTGLEIVCPGEISSAPAGQRISFEDLYVEHDDEADRLVLRSKLTGDEVIPVYLGYLVPVALPEIPRTLLLFSQSATVLLDPWGGVPADDAARSGGVTVRPRVRHHDVVISRRSWRVSAADLPQRVTGVPEAQWFLAWQRWRREHGLPSAVFATVHNPADDEQQTGDYGMSRLAKPSYVDFDSHLSLSVLDSSIKGDATTVVFREMLPAEDGLTVTSDGGRHVAEMVVETTTHGARKAEKV